MLCTALTLILVLTSCSIEKRHYTSGYHIEGLSRSQRSGSQHSSAAKLPPESVLLSEAAIRQPVRIMPVRTVQADTPDTVSDEYLDPVSVQPAHASAKAGEVYTVAGNNTEEQEIAAGEQPGNNLGKLTPRGESGNNVVRGLLIMLVAVALFGLGFLFYSLLGTFGVVLLLVFGIGAAVFFIAGLIMLVFG